ncbi:hypothetical protein PHYSODRAFT_342999 [Phytophthora sojae]|uniref:Uncharacterized protein n=1 Tax=Phytophthora sojae (strain P6497) TaxID=1094619 RepID=G5AI89_PHYSP|nr:hypothetical protein PHYSODRAFT_331990 [Phytophthora sojae]XP_009539790.1 hypothetical protein PHYSODRAFT_342999 [Phytophthora sojae]EGZ04814.1 hypothetical protein PHYSODRAFT_342999 [Phytophthora sojae]EGZ18135.1 hypothetical protein PHYSODRAFT_331990 [Phytophthora sojae]|eukprot:XP_009527193.1 hypothetical protein PHYSODRAFT_331990 [Phytophthora sojae]
MVRPVFQRAPSRTNTVDDVDERNTSFLRNLQSSHAYSPETSLQPDTDMLDLSEENTSGVPHTGAHSNSKPQRRVRAPSDDVKAVESPPLGKRRYSARSQAEDLNTLMPIIKKKPSHFRSQRRREQCRINQIRSEKSVRDLQRDIPVLELQRARLQYGDQQDVWGVVIEYFKMFRFGVLVPTTVKLEGAQAGALTSEAGPYNVEVEQLAFLRSSLASDVVLGERSGVEALMDQWRWYSTYFDNLYFQLERIKRVSDKFVRVSATLSVTVSEATLEGIFPYLTSEPLKSKLLRQTLRLPCVVCFEWDAVNNCVARLETTVDFINPLTKLLGNLTDVAAVLELAHISRDGVVGRPGQMAQLQDKEAQRRATGGARTQ